MLDFSDAMVFAMAFVNVLALYVFAPGVKRDLDAYWSRVRTRRPPAREVRTPHA